MKKLVSLVLTLTLVLSLCAVTTLNTGAAQADLAQTSAFMFKFSGEPYQEVTPINGYVCGIFGDADLDSEVSVIDATVIQRVCALITDIDEDAFLLADVDMDEDLTVLDATKLQQFLADMSDDGLISHTLYFDNLITYTFDQIAEYLMENGSYDADYDYYSAQLNVEEPGVYEYSLLMVYTPKYECIDFHTALSEPDSDITVVTLMTVERDNPEFEYSCSMGELGVNHFDVYGNAELIDMNPDYFCIDNYSYDSDYSEDFSDFEEIVVYQFTQAITTADEMLKGHIDGTVYDIFW